MDKFIREAFISTLVGVPYKKNAKGPQAYDCWHLTKHVEDIMFGRSAPEVEIPQDAGWNWMISQFKSHPELLNWVEILQPANGLITASDGAIVLMARNKQPAHCGVFFQQERSILHADETLGVVFQDIPTLKTSAWAKLRYFEPR